MDGLAIMPVSIIAIALGIFAYVTGNFNFAEYLDLPFLQDAGEVFVFCCAISGAGLGFLWFNTYPAQIFMGRCRCSITWRNSWNHCCHCQTRVDFGYHGRGFYHGNLISDSSGWFIQAERKRIFNMAPIHHHFELKGWAEPKVIVRFWIITVFLVLIGLSSLKIR